MSSWKVLQIFSFNVDDIIEDEDAADAQDEFDFVHGSDSDSDSTVIEVDRDMVPVNEVNIHMPDDMEVIGKS